MLAYLFKKNTELSEERIVDRVGSAYALLNVKRLAKPSLVLLLLVYLRNIGLCIAITFGNKSLISQLFFLNISSILILRATGISRPYETRGTLWLELANESVIRILLLNLLMCQTNFVNDLSARSAMSWVFIGIVIKMIVINQFIVSLEGVSAIKLRCKRELNKRKSAKQRKLQN